MQRMQKLYFTVFSLCLLLAGAIITPAVLHADIYSYVDKNGVIHFSNAPSSTKYEYYSPETIPLHPKKLVVYRSPKKSYKPRNTKAYDDIIKEASNAHGLNFGLVKAVIQAESAFNPNAVSPAGALGLMQIMPENLSNFGVQDPFNPRDNVMGGTKYLKELLERYDSDLSLVLAAYNAGPGAVEKYKNIPPYRETTDYVEKVLQYYDFYKNQQP